MNIFLLLRILILALFSFAKIKSFKINYNKGEVIVKINKIGSHKFLSDTFSRCPDEIYINNKAYDFSNTNCYQTYLKEEKNVIKLK